MALHELEVYPEAPLAAIRTAELIGDRARAAVAERGAFTLALSGGSGPWQAFRLLADMEVPWDAVEIFQVDERIAPAGDDDRNLTHLQASLPPEAWARLHPMPVDADDLEAAAVEYAALLPERLDLVHLGLGPDGHTASLFPGTDAVRESRRLVMAHLVEKLKAHRITLTPPVFNSAGRVVFLVTGREKAAAFARIRSGRATPDEAPAAAIRPRDGTLAWYVDVGAAGS